MSKESRERVVKISDGLIKGLGLTWNIAVRITDKPSIELIDIPREDVYKVAEYLGKDPEVMLEENYYTCDHFKGKYVLDIFDEESIEKINNDIK